MCKVSPHLAPAAAPLWRYSRQGENRLPSPVATGEGLGVRAFPIRIDIRDHFSAIVIRVTFPFASCAGSISIFSRRCACVIE